MRSGDALLDHLFRRAGFGASAADLQAVSGMSYAAAVDYFVDFDKQSDDVDSKIGLPDAVAVTTRGSGTTTSASATPKSRASWAASSARR